MSAFYF